MNLKHNPMYKSIQIRVCDEETCLNIATNSIPAMTPSQNMRMTLELCALHKRRYEERLETEQDREQARVPKT